MCYTSELNPPEFMIKGNTANKFNGERAFWINDQLARHYFRGSHYGQWLHSQFVMPGNDKYDNYPRKQGYFEGFNFRKSPDVKIRRLELEYYQSGWSLNQKGFADKAEHNVYFDNVIVAKKRIDCMR
jgi:hypothetical protein